MQQEQSSGDAAPTKANGAGHARTGVGAWKRTGERRAKVAALVKQGMGAPAIAKRLRVTASTIYADIATNKGRPYNRGKKQKAASTHASMAKGAVGRVSMPVYKLARDLQRVTRAEICAQGGHVSDQSMASLHLTKALLGE